MLLAKLTSGAASVDARWSLEMATREGAACLGRSGEIGELSVGACADLAIWDLNGVPFAGAIGDPVEAWLRCGPMSARDTIVDGCDVVRDGRLVSDRVEELLAAHTVEARRIQGC